jgi:hypothetical protein
MRTVKILRRGRSLPDGDARPRRLVVIDLLFSLVRVHMTPSWQRSEVLDQVVGYKSTSTQNEDPISETGDQIDLL